MNVSAIKFCSQELCRTGRAYPRYCAMCGLGPCQKLTAIIDVPLSPSSDFLAYLEALEQRVAALEKKP